MGKNKASVCKRWPVMETWLFNILPSAIFVRSTRFVSK
jgi:hypothetical protein